MKPALLLSVSLLSFLLIGSLTIGCSGGDNSTENSSAADQLESMAQSAESSAAELAKTAMTQTVCPIMGNEIDKKIFADHKGKRIYFCCPPCIDKFKSDPDTYINKLEAAGVVLDAIPEAG